MNGRIYDPTLGRFLQADPFIQAPQNSQSYNRYSYVLNNPLGYTDPSGYFFKSLFKKLNKALGKFAPFVGIALLAIPGVGQWAAGAWWKAATVGFISGGVATGSLKGALIGAFTGAALQQIGSSSYWGQAGSGQNILANATVGGISSELSGGKFGHGFLAAGFTSALKPAINDIGGENSANAAIARGDEAALSKYMVHRVVASAVVGGTASVISGGKFANGAVTGAFTQAFNGENSNRKKVEWVVANPEHARVMQQMRGLAQDAALEYDSGCETWKCALPWIRGTGIHKIFADKVNALGTDFEAEVSYKDGVPVPYGTKGSVRADAIYGPRANPEIVFELNTGFWNYMSRGEAHVKLVQAILQKDEIDAIRLQTDLHGIQDKRDSAILTSLFACGLRAGEVARLKISSVNFDAGYLFIYQSKGEKDRVVPVAQASLDVIAQYLKDVRPKLMHLNSGNALFLCNNGQQFTRRQLTAMVSKHKRRAGVAKRGACNLYRHTTATTMLNNGAEISVVQKMLGHKSINTTQIYTHVAVQRLAEDYCRFHPAASGYYNEQPPSH